MADDGTSPAQSEYRVQQVRAWTGLFVVVAGDLAIAMAAVLAAYWLRSGGADMAQLIAVLTAAFTAISTMTTAYFGIRAVTNTAQSAVTASVPAARAPDGASG